MKIKHPGFHFRQLIVPTRQSFHIACKHYLQNTFGWGIFIFHFGLTHSTLADLHTLAENS